MTATRKKPSRRVMKEFVITEISAVDSPAQEGARAVIMKRADVEKRMPAPKEDESKDDFVARFMANEAMRTEYPKQAQRVAVAMSQWKRSLEKAQGRHPAGNPQGGQFAPGQAGTGRAVTGGSIKHDQQSGMWESSDSKGKRKLHGSESQARRHLAAQHAKRPILFGPGVGGSHAMGKQQEGAVYTKRLRLTTAEDGHSHLVDDSLEGGNTSYDKAESDDYGHSHPWVRNSDGTITIGESSGHGHDVMLAKAGDGEDEEKPYDEEDGDGVDDSKGKKEKDGGKPAPRRAKKNSAETADDVGNDEGNMTDTKKSVAGDDAATVQKNLDTAKTENARLTKMLDLNDAERSFMKSLPKEQQDAFLAASPTDRSAQVRKANEANEVVFKADDGREFRKSDDPRLVAMAKQNDETARELRKAREEQANANFMKRADDEIPNLPGTTTERGALLKAIEAMPATEKEAALKALKAGSNALAGTFKRHGHSDASGGEGGTPQEQLDKKAKELAKSKNVSYIDAYDIVRKENPELYAKAVTGSQAPATAQVVGG